MHSPSIYLLHQYSYLFTSPWSYCHHTVIYISSQNESLFNENLKIKFLTTTCIILFYFFVFSIIIRTVILVWHPFRINIIIRLYFIVWLPFGLITIKIIFLFLWQFLTSEQSWDRSSLSSLSRENNSVL